MTSQDKVATLVGHVDIIKKVPSRQAVQIIIELPVEFFKSSVRNFDDEDVFVQVMSKEMKDTPYAVHELPIDDFSHKGNKPVDSPAQETATKESNEPVSKIGKRCIEAIDFCKDEGFQYFMMRVKGTLEPSEAAAKDELCIICNVDSRKELDGNDEAHSIAQDIYREFIDYNIKLKNREA